MPPAHCVSQVEVVNLARDVENAMKNRPESKLLGAEPAAEPQELTEYPFVACPEPGCGTVAEVVDRYTLSSTDGPVVMMRTRCLAKHVRDWLDEA